MFFLLSTPVLTFSIDLVFTIYEITHLHTDHGIYRPRCYFAAMQENQDLCKLLFMSLLGYSQVDFTNDVH